MSQRTNRISGDARQAHMASSMSSATSEQQPPQQPFPSRMLPSLRPGLPSGALPRPPEG